MLAKYNANNQKTYDYSKIEEKLGIRARKYTLDTFSAYDKYSSRLKEKAYEYISNIKKKNWLFAGGKSGTGKTHICIAICQELMKSGYNVRYESSNEILTKLKGKVMEEEYSRIMQQLTTAEILYLDDVFKSQRVTDSDIKIMFEIINGRYNRELITIISSEKTTTDLLKISEAEAIISRIVEMCDIFQLNITNAQNYRLIQKHTTEF